MSLAGVPFSSEGDAGVDAIGYLGENGRAIQEMLTTRNGVFWFESALRLFPSVTVDRSWGIHHWNQRALWKADYQGLSEDIFCFAEDVFGRQFCLRAGEICIFDVETAEVTAVAASIEDWASQILANYPEMTGWPIASAWQKSNGALLPRERLIPKVPFVLGGSYEPDNLVRIDSLRLMKTMANLATQIHDLPDGAMVQFKLL